MVFQIFLKSILRFGQEKGKKKPICKMFENSSNTIFGILEILPTIYSTVINSIP